MRQRCSPSCSESALVVPPPRVACSQGWSWSDSVSKQTSVHPEVVKSIPVMIENIGTSIVLTLVVGSRLGLPTPPLPARSRFLRQQIPLHPHRKALRQHFRPSTTRGWSIHLPIFSIPILVVGSMEFPSCTSLSYVLLVMDPILPSSRPLSHRSSGLMQSSQ